MKCPYCSAEQDDGSKFCSKCGANIESVQNTGQPPAGTDQSNQPYPSQPPNQAYPPPPYPPYQPQQPYQPNPYFMPDPRQAEVEAAAKRATTAMILGIISLFCAGIVLGIIAIVMGAQARAVLSKAQAPSGKALAGIILGIIGLVGAIIAMIFWFPTLLQGL